MPIHLRAEPGEYADGCLLPGDPLRAQYIAEKYLDQPVQRVAGEEAGLGVVPRFGANVDRHVREPKVSGADA